VPPQQGVGGDEKAAPPCPRQTSAEGSEDGPIGAPVPDTAVELPVDDSELVPEHHDLDVLVRLRPTARDNEAEEPAQTEVEEGEDHDG